MSGKVLTGLAGLAVLLLAAGCVCCRHTGYVESLSPVEECQAPPAVRQQVYLFMMNGADVFELAGMLGLRDKLCRAGYPKVYYAQRADAGWYARELRRVHRDEPDARLVLLGYGSAAEPVRRLACDAARDLLPVDAVVFLDPAGAAGNLPDSLPAHSVVVRSHGWAGAPDLSGHENLTAPDVGHFSLPNHPAAVDTIVRALAGAAGRVVLPTLDGLPRLPLRDVPCPTPRPVDPAVEVGQPSAWDALRVSAKFPTVPSDVVPAGARGGAEIR